MPPPVVAIAGATATGKTALAVALAERLRGEVVNADSRQVYRGLDIGTAKPTREERARARHWLVDILDPDQPFSLAEFLDLAHAAIADIRRRGQQPIVAGGTAQYLFALVEGWSPPHVPPDPALRAQLEALAERDGVTALAAELERLDPVRAASIDVRNPRRLIRAIEVARAGASASVPPSAPVNARVVVLDMPREALHKRIDARVDAMFAEGLVDEVRRLNAEGYACGLPALASIGYRECCELLTGRCSLADAVARTKTETHRLARMQATWLRRRAKDAVWLDARSPTLVDDALSAIRADTS
jgi:tRNA dimethylallyltransferase